MPYDAETYVQVSGPDHRGRVRLQWHDIHLEVRVNWGTIKTMQDAWGEDGFLLQVGMALDGASMDPLIRLASICCWHVETDERLQVSEAEDWTFPINPLRDAIRASWQYSWNGGEVILEKEAAEEGTEKKSKMGALLRWLSKGHSRRE